jgi:hypothetical protein
VKSVYLLTGRFPDPEDWRAYGDELDTYAGVLRAEGKVAYDEEQLAELHNLQQAVLAVTAGDLAYLLWRVVRPAILIGLFALGLFALLSGFN